MGLGGGVIVVPALLTLLELTDSFKSDHFSDNTVVLVVLGTSMATIVFTTFSSFVAQLRKKSVDWKIIQDWIVYLVLGVLLATVIANYLPGVATKLLIAAFIGTIATVMVTNWQPNPNRPPPSKTLTACIASTGGVICGLAGIGGGNVVVPTLLFFNTKIVKATAAASTLGIAISLAGTLGYGVSGLDAAIPYAVGFIYLPALIPIAIGCLFFAPVGVHIAHRVSGNGLRRAFGILMYFVAARMVYAAF